MDITGTKVEIGSIMNVTEDHWNSIFGTKEVKDNTEEDDEDGR